MKRNFIAVVLGLGILLGAGCTTDVQVSPQPGILRVTMIANNNDSILVILGDTARCSRIDRYNVIVSRGRLYHGENYVELYRYPAIDRIGADTVNLLQRQWPDHLVGANDPFEIPRWLTTPVQYTVFEWYTPPGTYDKLQFALSGIEVFVAIPRQFTNPLKLPDGSSSVMNFTDSFVVNEGRVTEVDLVIDLFKSIDRYRDTYIFNRQVRIARITNH